MNTPHLFRPLRVITALAAALSGPIVFAARQPPPVPYPEGFRSWQHVKSDVVGPDHRSFPNRGGFHHFYANAAAIAGYRTGKFPDGSVIVDENVAGKDGENAAKGMLLEGDRRGIDVMVKNDRVYKDTGGWGFEHFNGSDRTGTLPAEARSKCFECHGKQTERDSVFGRLRQ